MLGTLGRGSASEERFHGHSSDTNELSNRPQKPVGKRRGRRSQGLIWKIKREKARMKNQGIGQDGMGWEGVLESLCLGNSYGKSKCRIKKCCKNSL